MICDLPSFLIRQEALNPFRKQHGRVVLCFTGFSPEKNCGFHGTFRFYECFWLSSSLISPCPVPSMCRFFGHRVLLSPSGGQIVAIKMTSIYLGVSQASLRPECFHQALLWLRLWTVPLSMWLWDWLSLFEISFLWSFSVPILLVCLLLCTLRKLLIIHITQSTLALLNILCIPCEFWFG
jgi:hypothetical protein